MTGSRSARLVLLHGNVVRKFACDDAGLLLSLVLTAVLQGCGSSAPISKGYLHQQPLANAAPLVAGQELPHAAPVVSQPNSGKSRQCPASLAHAPDDLLKRPGYTQFQVTVTDKGGAYAEGLQKSDFKIFEDAHERPVEFFRADKDSAASIGIVVDTSGSMQLAIPAERTLITDFVNDLNTSDEAFLIAFSREPFLLQGFTTDRSKISDVLGLLHPYGQTALYDVAADSIAIIERGCYETRALLLISDGNDTGSRLHQRDDVVEQARAGGVLVYTLGIGPGPSSRPNSFLGSLFAGPRNEIDEGTLRDLAVETGGRSFIVKTSDEDRPFAKVAKQVATDLHEHYTIGFVSGTSAPAKLADTRVVISNHPNAEIRMTRTLVGGANSVSAR
jgi:VWFA-related protein